ncbi:MAG: NAD-dependent epimerase/dehydratase family protein [Verrucomicrobia bacterium]|nr:NAD-dependent epimerase/dehydratase family protein [Verrucomicrobiota bacterium]
MSKILVLGGKGFLGKHAVRVLEQEGHEVRSLSRTDGCDITDLGQITAALRELQPAAIINCAAHVGSLHYVTTYAADVIHDNTLMIANTYRAVQQACPKAKLINPISNCSYPGAANTHYEPDWQNGPVHDSVLAYATPRRLFHAFAESYRKQHGLKTVNWLIANSYGPGDYTDPNKVHALNGIIIRLIKAQRGGERTFEIWGSGKPLREWSYIADDARILVASLGIEEQTYPVNFAQNKAYSIAEIAGIAAQALGYDVQFVFNMKMADGAPIKILDDRIFRSKHPDFRFTPLADGIRNTIAYYKEVL